MSQDWGYLFFKLSLAEALEEKNTRVTEEAWLYYEHAFYRCFVNIHCYLNFYSDYTCLSSHIFFCSQGFYHQRFEARLVAAVHRAGIVGIGLVILLFLVVQIIQYLHHLFSGTAMLFLRRKKQAVGIYFIYKIIYQNLLYSLFTLAKHCSAIRGKGYLYTIKFS